MLIKKKYSRQSLGVQENYMQSRSTRIGVQNVRSFGVTVRLCKCIPNCDFYRWCQRASWTIDSRIRQFSPVLGSVQNYTTFQRPKGLKNRKRQQKKNNNTTNYNRYPCTLCQDAVGSQHSRARALIIPRITIGILALRARTPLGPSTSCSGPNN